MTMQAEGLSGRRAVITGAGRGLGAALAIALAEAGSSVVLCGRNPAGLSDTAAIIRERTGSEPHRVALDLADPANVEAAGRQLAESEGIDILINNGAMWLEGRETAYSAEEVFGVVNAAVSGTFLLTQALLPALRRSSSPDIVTIGSISGLPNAALQSVSVPFYAAKHAQAALADGFRQMLAGSPIRSITVHPPYLDDMLPGDAEWQANTQRSKGSRGSNRDVVEAVIFALTRPRHLTLAITLDADDSGQFPQMPRG